MTVYGMLRSIILLENTAPVEGNECFILSKRFIHVKRDEPALHNLAVLFYVPRGNKRDLYSHRLSELLTRTSTHRQPTAPVCVTEGVRAISSHLHLSETHVSAQKISLPKK